MSKILSIDASTEACSVALKYGDSHIERFQIAPRQHANLVLPMVDELLAESQLTLSQLDAIACGVGPGAFTGIRIGVAIAQGLAYAASLPTIAVSSLASLAQQVWQEEGADICLSAIDARMNEVYFGVYRKNAGGIAEPIQDEMVIAPQLIDVPALVEILTKQDAENTSNFRIGSGWAAYEDIFAEIGLGSGIHLENRFPSAAGGLDIAKFKWESQQILAPHDLQPVYLRNNVAKKKSVKK